MASRPKVGETFTWARVDGSAQGTAVIRAIRTDRQEGLGPESGDYAALWIEAEGLAGAHAHEPFTVLLATDEKVYVDGGEIVYTPAAAEG